MGSVCVLGLLQDEEGEVTLGHSHLSFKGHSWGFGFYSNLLEGFVTPSGYFKRPTLAAVLRTDCRGALRQEALYGWLE